ncbi:MAG: NAD(P)/FAD-dependent oxidoreductase [Thermoanaerobaculaceae bacterium]|nr:NAD(P)/FAD-dependent oxidoreductase [Thermoanaerobaculaceae bacterium]
MDHPHRVVIVGGGFGGLHLAKALARIPVRVTLVDRRNFHLFQPLLYQVATGALSPANIAAPLRAVLKRARNVQVLLGEAKGVDAGNRRLILGHGEVPYDTLVVAAGASHHYFGHDEWAARAPGLKTVEDATDIRRRILLAFEAAERETAPELRRIWMTFVIVGGGPTGVELSGALAEIARDTLKLDFRVIDPGAAKIVLVEGTDRILPSYPPELSAKARTALERLGVTVRTGVLVSQVETCCVELVTAAGTERVETRTVLWAAGVQGSALSHALADTAGAELDRNGRVLVGPDLAVPGHPEILVIGDLACVVHGTGRPLPGVAPVAIQQGRYAARVIAARVNGRPAPSPFRYRDRGNLATIGRASAVADMGWLRFSGFPAWLTWLFVHLMNLVEFESRLLVLLQWAWAYTTFNRAARLITGKELLPGPTRGPCSCGIWLGADAHGAPSRQPEASKREGAGS